MRRFIYDIQITKKINKIIFSIIGKQFTGTTCCIIGYQCYKQDDYYSQCLTSCPSGWSCQQTQQSLTTPTPIGQLQYGQCGGFVIVLVV